MKKQITQTVAIFLITSLLISMTVTAFAVDTGEIDPDRSSAYISAVYADASKGNSAGKLNVYFRITATGPMTSLGSTTIAVKDTGGNIVALKSYTSTSGMMGYNKTIHYNTISFTGLTSGAMYYAVVIFKAANSSGSDATSYTTGYAIAG